MGAGWVASRGGQVPHLRNSSLVRCSASSLNASDAPAAPSQDGFVDGESDNWWEVSKGTGWFSHQLSSGKCRWPSWAVNGAPRSTRHTTVG